MRAEESGESECRRVTGRTGVEEWSANIILCAYAKAGRLPHGPSSPGQMRCLRRRVPQRSVSGRTRAPARPFEWRDTNWSDCHRRVRSLQTPIVKAWPEGTRRKAKTLQRLLIRSLSGKALAVKRVTENQGRWTPGVDGAIWSTPDTKSEAVLSLRKQGYKPRPLRRVYVLQFPSLLSSMAQRSRFAHSSERNSDLGSSDGDCRTHDIVTICDVTVHASVTNSITWEASRSSILCIRFSEPLAPAQFEQTSGVFAYVTATSINGRAAETERSVGRARAHRIQRTRTR
jgi:hypothetical protein